MKTMKDLEYFIQPAILRQIGSPRLGKFFDGFHDDLKSASILLPRSETENGSYFDSLAPILGSSALPRRLRSTLLTLEAAAAPENQDRLDTAIQRRIPCVSLSPCCALDRALELWFHAPDELSQFQTNHVPSENAASQAPSIEHSEPSTEHGGTDAAPVALEADAQPQESSRKDEDESRITSHVTMQQCNHATFRHRLPTRQSTNPIIH